MAPNTRPLIEFPSQSPHIPSMQRRSFIKYMAAATSAPLMPSHLLNASPMASGTYAQAVSLTKSSSYLSLKYLKTKFGLNETGLNALVTRLQADGFVGQAGNSGLLFSKKCFENHVVVALNSAQALEPKEALPEPDQKLAQTTEPSRTSNSDLSDLADDPVEDEDHVGITQGGDPDIEGDEDLSELSDKDDDPSYEAEQLTRQD